MELCSLSLLIIGSVLSSLLIIKHVFSRYAKQTMSASDTSLLSHSSHSKNCNTVNIDNDDPYILYTQIRENEDKLSLDAIEFIKDIINKYTLEHLAFSFNGGKDCVVLLYLIRIALKLLNKQDEQLPIIWFQRNNEFQQLVEFLRFCVKKYKFPLFETCNDYKSGLEHYLKHGNPSCHAVFLGQRDSDPYCANLHLSTHCTSGWPDIMRINPILHWTYNDVWRFLLKYNLAYCCLYDHGYTSLGGIHETIPNPLLYDRHLVKFKPAHQLNHYQNAERFGRLIRNKSYGQVALITDKIKVLVIGGRSQINENMMENIKMGVETSFVNGILNGKQKLSVDIEVLEKDKNDERLKWCKQHYQYVFYANILDDLQSSN
mmetsp:Transcript_45664/g.73086  ORF Transcript_45664/g.73086 Transcript_45664/m.73086 type:complete len:374 (+) Transcript_45664:394-1515(+)